MPDVRQLFPPEPDDIESALKIPAHGELKLIIERLQELEHVEEDLKNEMRNARAKHLPIEGIIERKNNVELERTLLETRKDQLEKEVRRKAKKQKP